MTAAFAQALQEVIACNINMQVMSNLNCVQGLFLKNSREGANFGVVKCIVGSSMVTRLAPQGILEGKISVGGEGGGGCHTQAT